MSTKHAEGQQAPSAGEQARIEAIRDRFQRERPDVEDLVAAGDAEPPVPGPQFFAVRQMGRRLREERERQGLSLTEASERSGIERGMLSRLENGRILNPTLGTLSRYATALGRSIRLELGGEPRP